MLWQASFLCDVDVRQGENLSPLLFSIFLNMSEFLSHAYQGLDLLKDCTSQKLSDDDIGVYFKLYVLLYADSTIIMAYSECELQATLNAAHHYGTLWKLVLITQNQSDDFFIEVKVEIF